MLRELRYRRQVSRKAQTALEEIALTLLLMSCIISVPLLTALLSAVIH